MSADRIFKSFLRSQLELGMRLSDESDILDLIPVREENMVPIRFPDQDDPPDTYIAVYHANGLVQEGLGEIREFGEARIRVHLPGDYLRRARTERVLQYLGPHPQPFHPNFLGPLICLNIKPATPLTEVLFGLYEAWSWQYYVAPQDPLNRFAAQWARANQDRLPIDARPLKRREVKVKTEWREA